MFSSWIKSLIAFYLIVSIPMGLSAITAATTAKNIDISTSGTEHTSSPLCNIHDSVNSQTMGRSNSNFCKMDSNLNGGNRGGGNSLNKAGKHLLKNNTSSSSATQALHSNATGSGSTVKKPSLHEQKKSATNINHTSKTKASHVTPTHHSKPRTHHTSSHKK